MEYDRANKGDTRSFAMAHIPRKSTDSTDLGIPWRPSLVDASQLAYGLHRVMAKQAYNKLQ